MSVSHSPLFARVAAGLPNRDAKAKRRSRKFSTFEGRRHDVQPRARRSAVSKGGRFVDIFALPLRLVRRRYSWESIVETRLKRLAKKAQRNAPSDDNTFLR